MAYKGDGRFTVEDGIRLWVGGAPGMPERGGSTKGGRHGSDGLHRGRGEVDVRGDVNQEGEGEGSTLGRMGWVTA